MGMGAKKTWDATTNAAYTLDPDTGKWARGAFGAGDGRTSGGCGSRGP